MGCPVGGWVDPSLIGMSGLVIGILLMGVQFVDGLNHINDDNVVPICQL